jgi:ABC-type transport system involved in cytochrome c biogenesis permease component
MNIRLLAKYWRTILVVAEMNIRQQMTDGFILFTVLFQPIIIAMLGLWMLKDKGPDAAMFVVVGSGLTGLWSSLLFISGNSINAERWSGTLESRVALPTPFPWVFYCCICIWLLTQYPAAIAVYDLGHPCDDRIY